MCDFTQLCSANPTPCESKFNCRGGAPAEWTQSPYFRCWPKDVPRVVFFVAAQCCTASFFFPSVSPARGTNLAIVAASSTFDAVGFEPKVCEGRSQRLVNVGSPHWDLCASLVENQDLPSAWILLWCILKQSLWHWCVVWKMGGPRAGRNTGRNACHILHFSQKPCPNAAFCHCFQNFRCMLQQSLVMRTPRSAMSSS